MPRYTLATVLSGLLLSGCPDPEGVDDRAFIAPADGQSNVSNDQVLLVRTGSLEMPPNYPLPSNFIRVIDLAEGGHVPGAVVRSGDDLLFIPDSPWQSDRRYSWTVDEAASGAHGPEFSFPEELQGTAVFDTSSDLWLLAATTDPDLGLTCLVFSRPLAASEVGDINVTVDDVPVSDVTFQELPAQAVTRSFALLEGDAGLGVFCLVTAQELEVGNAFRLWWGGEGPWSTELLGNTVSEVLGDLRREIE
jgi:hypothetical protein